eukprot:TRINITY_DN416_c0_g1_i1.p1 TRINITY_DN416_c0_g1~~TRINITY_DN416_c0_g1_i1.p1  ORF type:complete len:255 (+),score=53.23 TRINITY_DN416_c0_g1_i1:57-821(+)
MSTTTTTPNSTSTRISRKMYREETKRSWENKLQPYKDAVLYFRSVLVWQRPIDFGVLLAVITLSVWLFFNLKYTVLTMASTLLALWTVGSFVKDRANYKIPFDGLLPPSYREPTNDYFGEAVGMLVQLRYAVGDAIESLLEFRASNPPRFAIQMTLACILIAYIGSFASGSVFFLLGIYAILLTPGIIANSVPSKSYAVIEPYVKVYVEKLLVLKDKALVQINQRLSGIQINGPNTPKTTPQPATTEQKGSKAE